MSLTTLTNVKLALGIASTNTSEDANLTKLIRGCSFAIRAYTKRFLGGLITSNSVAAASIITAPGHGLQTGDTIVISGTNSTVSIDGTRVVTRLTDDTFSVPVDTTGVNYTAGTAGHYVKQFTEYYSGRGSQEIILNERPVQSIVSLYLDPTGRYGDGPNAFAAETLLVAGTDYQLRRDNNSQIEKSKSGIVYRINGVWPGRNVRSEGLLASYQADGMGNIKVTYVAGYSPVHPDHQMACEQYVALVRNQGDRGGPLSSERYDYYSYTLAPQADPGNVFGSVRGLLADVKGWVI